MLTFVKWILAALLSGFARLVTSYTFEYFKPYNKSGR